MMRGVTGFGLGVLFALAGCSNSSSQPPVAAAPAAPAPAMASATPDAMGATRATHCHWAGVHWMREMRIAPTMTVTNDGYCAVPFSVTSNTPIILQVVTPPQHGTLTTSGSETSQAVLHYTPQTGYVGADGFTVLTGRSSHAVTAAFAVTVTG